MTRPSAHDLPGPHPELRRKRRELKGPRDGLIGLLAVVAVLALGGGIALLAGVDGRQLLRPGLPAGSPAMAFRGTGVVLVLVIGGSQALAAWLLVRHQVRARAMALVAALILIGWSVAQLLLLNGVSNFQLVTFSVGALEVFLVAGCTPRDSKPKKPLR